MKVRIDNDAVALALEVAKAGPGARWCSRRPTADWAADVLATEGAQVHLAHPLGTTEDTAQLGTSEGQEGRT